MSVLYKDYLKRMLKENKKEFDEFKKIHDIYALNPDENQNKLNEVGKKIQLIIKKYEDMLCGRQEGTGYGSYSGGLADKFQNEIKKMFPKIDNVGLIVKKPSIFGIKRIKLN